MLVGTALLVGCAGEPTPSGEATSRPSPPTGESAAASCSPEQQVAEQGGGHLIADAQPPVPYTTIPPTSGWHASGGVDVTVRTHADALTETQQVKVLESGGVVVTYNDVAQADLEQLVALVEDRYAGRVAVTPYDKLSPGQVAFTAWRFLQLCQGIDTPALAAFADAHAQAEIHQD